VHLNSMKLGVSRLLIVSHVVHYQHEGRVYAYGPYAREIEIWADLFPEVGIASPLRRELPPKDCLPFVRPNIFMIPQMETGGDSARAKLLQILSLPVHLVKLSAAMATADAIHVRCPGNLGLLGALLAPLFSRRLVAKYAGEWHGAEHVALSFRWQRRILSSRWWRRGVVTVYGEWPNQPKQIVPFFTSMMTEDQMRVAARAAARKSLRHPIQLLYSGRLFPAKGVDLLIRGAHLLIRQGAALEVTILGDGPERPALEQLSVDLGLRNRVRFAGAVPYDEVMTAYDQAHILVLASNSEGWPKVVTEAMCHGVVCIGSARGLMPWMLTNRGATVPPGDAEAVAAAILDLTKNPQKYLEMSHDAAQWARRYSIESLRDALRTLLSDAWKVNLRAPSPPVPAAAPSPR
jgi:glycosyltransferase involved in cell wall biosynthesis